MIDIKSPNIVKSILILIFSYILFSIFGCNTQKTIVEEQKTLEKKPKLIFLNYSISSKENGEKNIKFINQVVTDGKLKNSSTNFLKKQAIGDLKCSQLDKNSNELQNLFIENPLKKNFEFVNDSLLFERKKVILQTTELSLRLQLNSRTKSILISEVIDSLQHTKTLIKTELK